MKTRPSETSTPAPAGPARTDAAASGDKATYWRDKIPRLVAQGNSQKALEIVDRYWPPGAAAARAATLLRVWPARLASELPDPLPPELTDVMALAPLVLDDDALDLLLAAPGVAPIAPDLRAARAAHARLASGDAAGAREALTPIALRSPLRHVRLYLRALAALQAGADDEVRRALATLAGTPLAPLAARVTAALDGQDPALAAQLGLGVAADPGLSDALARFRDRRPTEALARLHGLAPTLPAPLLRLLRRELPAALLAAGVPAPDINARIRRALGTDPDDPDAARASALLLERAGCIHCAAAKWTAYSAAVKRGAALRGVDRALAEPALLARAGRALLRDLRGRLERDDDFLADDFFDDPHSGDLAEARRLLERALALDPARAEPWDDLAETLGLLGDRSARIALVERRVAAFPDDIDALVSAADACARRRSFLKAATYAGRAAALAPHDPRVRDVQADILVGRAYKQLGSRRPELALATFREAARLPDLSRDARLTANAATAVAEITLGSAAAADRLRADALAEGVGPWEWTASLYDEAASHLAEQNLLRAEKTPAPPSTAPTAQEIGAVLDIANAATDERRMTVALRDLARQVAEAATVLTDPQGLRQALDWVEDGEPALALAEHAARCHPDTIDFSIMRYQHALAVGRSRDYYVGALAELDALAERVHQDLQSKYGDSLPEARIVAIAERSMEGPGGPRDLQRRVAAILDAGTDSAAPSDPSVKRVRRAGRAKR